MLHFFPPDTAICVFLRVGHPLPSVFSLLCLPVHRHASILCISLRLESVDGGLQKLGNWFDNPSLLRVSRFLGIAEWLSGQRAIEDSKMASSTGQSERDV